MIRNKQHFFSMPPACFDGEFSWDFLRGAFGSTIEPMDFDAVVERNGHFLIFETKQPGAKMPFGQRLALTRMVQIPKSVTVVILHGKRLGEFTDGQVIWKDASAEDGLGGRDLERVDRNTLWALCAKWFRRHGGEPIPQRAGESIGADAFGITYDERGRAQ